MFNLKYAISQALQENQSKDKILIKIIRILKNIDLNQKKEDDFLKEIAENPRNAQAHLDYANFLSIEMDDDKTAEEHFQLALKHGAANPKIHIGYAKHCFQEKRIDEAYKHLDLAIELEPENSETWEVIPGLWMHDDFKNAKTDDFNPDPIKMERYERYFRQAFQIVPNSAQLHGDYAFWLFWIKKERFGEIPQTIAHFEKAIELEPQNSGHYMNLLGLMDITRRQEYIPRIEQMYEDLLIKFPKDNGIIHMYLSFLRYSKQDYAKVEKLYMQMIENEPDNYGVYLSIADFYMSVKNDLEKAGLMLQEALDLANPKIKSEYNYIKTWWVSFQLLIGNIDEGLRELYTLEEFKKYDDMQMYIQFLHYVYGKTEEERTIALRKFKTMLIDYRKNNDLVWDRFYFGNHVENVKVHHHPDQKLLRTIKNVISGAMEPKKLDKFPIWANLEPWIEIETIKKEE
jgi:tetratricopeptide (TPR) repeat protein